MLERAIRVVLVCGLIGGTVLLGCGPRERPPGAFGASSDPNPPGAVELSESEYDELIAAGWRPYTPESLAEQTARAEAQYEEDLAVIRAFQEAHPEAGDLLWPEVVADGKTVRDTGDGNFLLTVRARDGGTLEVVTHGRRWRARALADSLREFPLRDNQLGIYRILYKAVPEDLRGELDLAPPDDLAELEVAELLSINRSLASPEITEAILGAWRPAQPGGPDLNYLTDCDLEAGAGAGLDRLGSCQLDPTGIVANYTWSQKPFLTCVKAQQSRGTCTAFANTSAIEMLVRQTHGKRVNLSEQAYYNRARLSWVAGGDFGDGLNSWEGFEQMQKEGFLLYFEDQWNYNRSSNRVVDNAAKVYKDSCLGYSETCSDTTHQSARGCFNSAWWKFCIYWVPEKNPNSEGFRIGNSLQFWDLANRDSSLNWLKVVLATDHPAVLGHPITGAWGAAADGWVDYKPNDSIGAGHGSHAVGFITNDQLKSLLPASPPGAGGGYFIIKNSWGRCAGDGGFYYLPYQSLLDYTADVTVLFSVL